jgi:hypothetical protein
MPKKIELPDTAPKFKEGHVVTFTVTIVSGLISALALAYHIHRDAVIADETIKIAFVALSAAFAFLMAMTPISLARAHGTALEGGNAQSGLMLIVLMVMLIDGALQVHAAQFILAAFGKSMSIWILVAGAVAFQLALFFVRGALYAASNEIQELIDARAHEAKMAEIYAKEKQLAKRREKYHEQKLHVVR